ncbi:transient receptor potential cation channel subfamily A member 1 homolog isoform X2 [Asterias rubens]|uniref:transient receptor potential cation channel subfamily A member 1 homolog isoform X2 n=1 Tax=Asterias rubens TaxID=7604 RepID=UPI001455B701|nr:transient receptor potential cation channel subfamily A member 1 homolog isoform X2 [Asterias rubens]
MEEDEEVILRPLRVARGGRGHIAHSDTEALLVAEAAKDLPPIAYAAPVDDDDLPGDCGDVSGNTPRKQSITQAWLTAKDSTSSEIRSSASKGSIASISKVDLRPTRVSTVRSGKVAPSPSPSHSESSPKSSDNRLASVSSSTGNMPTSKGGLDREDTVEMGAWRRRHGSGDSDDDSNRRANKYAPNWPTQAELDAADGLGGGLAASESTEDLANLISIHQAARDGEVETMRRYLEQIGSNKRRRVNKLDENNLSALHYAARYNHIEIVKLLIKHQADPGNKGDDNTTPIHFAARCKRPNKATATVVVSGQDGGDEDNDEDDEDATDETTGIITFLQSAGADINAQDIYGQSPLHFAAMRGNDIAAKELLSSNKILFEAVDKQLMTPLHMACTHGNLEVAKMLIEKGAQLRCCDEENNTPLLVACTEGHIKIVQLLFAAGENQGILSQMLTDRDVELNTAIHVAVDSGKQEIVQMCLEKGANVNTFDYQRNTSLHVAAAAGHLNIVKLLLQRGARIDALNAERATALHRACAFNRQHVVEFLIKSGAKLERRDKDNFTPLLIAASNGHSATIAELLKRGGNIRAVDKHEKSAVYWAAQENEVQALTVLLDHRKHKAKKLLMESDRYNNTPLHIAAEKGYIQIVKILLERGASLEAKNEEEQTALHLASKHGRVHTLNELVRQDITGINDEDENSNSPLHLAATEGHAKCVLALIAAGADIEARNHTLWTPLDCSAANGWVKCATALLENDSPVDPIDKSKTTPLHLACRNGHVEMVKLLATWGADLSLKDADNRNCLDLAVDKGHQNVALAIIGLKNWLHAMCSVSKDKYTKMRLTPMRKLIKKMPDVAEVVFNKCLMENDYPPEHYKYCITFDYELLDDMFSKWDDNSSDNTSEKSGGSDDSPFHDNGNLISSATPYTTDAEILRKNHPLTIMVNSRRDELLGHPLVTSLLQHKWDSYGRFFYYISLMFYILYLIFLTGYVTTNPPPFYFNMEDNKTVTWNTDGKKRWEMGFNPITHFIFGTVGDWVIIGLSGFNILKELVQMYHQKLNYIGFVNILEWFIYILSILFVLPLSGVSYPYMDGADCTESGAACVSVTLVWQWQCGAVAVFLAWINLILFLRKFPQFGIYIVMFTDVLKTFLQFAIVFFLFIIAFGLAFYALLMNQEPFHRVHYSLFKTFVMMIGEFEFDGIFHQLDYLDVSYEEKEGNAKELFLVKVHYKEVTYFVFTIFVILLSIIVMNLLVGLAVDDIKGVQEQAKLQRLGMQVNLAMEVQEALPRFMWRRSIMKKLTVYPNQQSRSIWAKFYRWYSGREELIGDAINTALNPPMTKLEEIKMQQDDLTDTVKNVKYRLKMLRVQNDRIEGMLEALIKKQEVDWQEGEAEEEVGE